MPVYCTIEIYKIIELSLLGWFISNRAQVSTLATVAKLEFRLREALDLNLF